MMMMMLLLLGSVISPKLTFNFPYSTATIPPSITTTTTAAAAALE